MADWKRLYTDASKMLDMYQNEIVPGLRKQIEELEADNERLRNMWAKAVSDASKAISNRVEVVRCKDCKHWERNATVGGISNKGYCHCNEIEDMETDDFCSYGERKVYERD